MIAFASTDGRILWQHAYQNARQNHPDTPIYHDGMLYVTSGYGKGADGPAIGRRWGQRPAGMGAAHSKTRRTARRFLVDGYVYASSHQSSSGRWSCVEFKTGRLMWQDAGVGKGGSVIYADGMLYCYSEDGTVGLVRPSAEKCQVISTFKVPLGDGTHWAHPVVAAGRLFIRHGNALMCYDIGLITVAPAPVRSYGR